MPRTSLEHDDTLANRAALLSQMRQELAEVRQELVIAKQIAVAIAAANRNLKRDVSQSILKITTSTLAAKDCVAGSIDN